MRSSSSSSASLATSSGEAIDVGTAEESSSTSCRTPDVALPSMSSARAAC
jgi:hypothetical protein